MARQRRNLTDGPRQLPLLCEHCTGPVSVQRSETQVVIRCARCDQDLLRIPLERQEDSGLQPAERDLLQQAPEPARALYEYLRRYLRRYGYAPSHRELRDAMGWSSVNMVRHYLDRLEEIGLIERDFMTPRGIRMPHAAWTDFVGS